MSQRSPTGRMIDVLYTKGQQHLMALDMIERNVEKAKAGDRVNFDLMFPAGRTGDVYDFLTHQCNYLERWELLRDVDILLGHADVWKEYDEMFPPTQEPTL
jgi:hypothetical protein